MPSKISYENIVYDWDSCGYLHYKDNLPERAFLEGIRTDMVLNEEVEIIEEQQDIDIQGIKEFIVPKIAKSEEADMWTNRIRINELIRAVKQLDRNINKE